jgi:hypothetical protein
MLWNTERAERDGFLLIEHFFRVKNKSENPTRMSSPHVLGGDPVLLLLKLFNFAADFRR